MLTDWVTILHLLLGDEAFVKEAKELAENMTTKGYTDWIFSRMRNTTQSTEYYGGVPKQVKINYIDSVFYFRLLNLFNLIICLL